MKISKKRLANKVRKLEVQNYDMRQKIKKMDELLTYIDELTTELNHALPDPENDAKCEENAVAVEESLDRHRERLGLNKPKLKQLDQSVFDGLDEKWRFAAVDANGKAHRCNLHVKPHHERGEFWRGCTFPPLEFELIGEGYDASNWEESLIERDIAKEPLEVDLSSELTGSELCKAMLARGDKYVMCLVGKDTDPHCHNHSFKEIAYKYSNLERCFCLIGGGSISTPPQSTTKASR